MSISSQNYNKLIFTKDNSPSGPINISGYIVHVNILEIFGKANLPSSAGMCNNDK